MQLEFITFHVALSKADEVHPNQTMEHQEYLSMIEMMFASARLAHPGSRRVVLTDEVTAFGASARRIDSVIRAEIDGSRLMFERAAAQERHILASRFDKPLAILDSDILVNAPLDPVFQHDFDVALTWRDYNREQPINGGFMLLNNRRPERGRAFFRHYMDIYRERHMQGHGVWFGDQMALRDCLGLSVEEMAVRPLVEVQGCKFLLLPCDRYNHSPENRFGAIAQELRDAAILHFKGERKRLMQPYWEAWIAPRQLWSLPARLRSRSARRELARHVAAESGSAPVAGRRWETL